MNNNLFDDLDNEQDRIDKFLAFNYGSFSNEIRQRLLSKNAVKPKNLYDIYYTQIREDNLSKNQPSLVKPLIDSQTEFLRNNLVQNFVEKEVSLEERSKNFRESLVARNDLSNISSSLESIANEARKNLLS